jgi:serine/threonine protein kinase
MAATTLAALVRASRDGLPEAEARFHFLRIATVLCSRHRRGIAPCGATLETMELRQLPLLLWPILSAPEWRVADTHPQTTPDEYASPEMRRGEASDAMSADVYAAGVMLYAMLTGGGLPCPGGRLALPGVSAGCLELVERMLSSDPAMRPTSAEVLDDPWAVPQRIRLQLPPGNPFARTPGNM